MLQPRHKYAQSPSILAILWSIAWSTGKDVPVETVTTMDKNQLGMKNNSLKHTRRSIGQQERHGCTNRKITMFGIDCLTTCMDMDIGPKNVLD